MTLPSMLPLTRLQYDVTFRAYEHTADEHKTGRYKAPAGEGQVQVNGRSGCDAAIEPIDEG